MIRSVFPNIIWAKAQFFTLEKYQGAQPKKKKKKIHKKVYVMKYNDSFHLHTILSVFNPFS